ncbi:putative DNA binding domain-containing protein [Fulvivirgaceae bacterium PWU5]|uniref:DNA binding domain-containing protein n=1 Tax=Dawidia cretensis TaxID=2782350 RepID=A0AAP2GQP3_9BACT|nr:ATP-binding protein [Dawidia cretensis]MBT1709886.1 putative DNA binding domain-containing protein [Dawidia cretensis]
MKLHESYTFHAQQYQQLKDLVARGEGLTLEFKRKAAFPDKIVREMIAFANTKGGILLVGIGDDLSIPGLKYPDDESYVIRQALQKCTPPLAYTETFIPVGNARTVLQYEIPESIVKPHGLLVGAARKESFVRVEDKSIKASREMRQIIRRLGMKRDVYFHYGDYEKLLMQYLDKHPSITLQTFMAISGLKKSQASSKLILLTVARVLKVTPHERGDLYSLVLRPGSRSTGT